MMRTYAFPVALGALLALGGLGAVMVLHPAIPASRAELARQIAADLRCPDCQGLSVADSSSPSAVVGKGANAGINRGLRRSAG